MDDDRGDEPTSEVVKNPLQIIQDAIMQVADQGALCAGFVVAVEWLETDGSNSLQVFHTPMTPWHMDGLLRYVRDVECAPLVQVFDGDEEDWDE